MQGFWNVDYILLLDLYNIYMIVAYSYLLNAGFPCSSVEKKLPANAGGMGSIPGSGRSPGEENGNPVQYSCLGNPMDRRAWQATVHAVTKQLDTTQQLNNKTEIHCIHFTICVYILFYNKSV